MIDHAKLAGELIAAVVEAGRVILEHRASGLEVSEKSDQSPVTAADRDAEAILIAALARVAPGVPVVAEEQAAAGVVVSTGHRFFLVDPIDGTRDFIAGGKDFTVNIGLIDGRRPLFGLIYAPAYGELFFTRGPSNAVWAQVDAAAAGPAFTALELVPLRVRQQPAHEPLVLLSTSSRRNLETDAFLANLGGCKTRSVGSSLKFCLIARGEADYYPRFGPTSEWDTAAGQAILEAAGGHVLDLTGRPLDYGKAAAAFVNPGFIASGPAKLALKGASTA